MKLRSAAMLASALCAISGCTNVTVSSYKDRYAGAYRINPQSDDVTLTDKSAKVRGVVYSLPYTVLLVEGGHCVTGEAAKADSKGDDKKADADKTTITITNAPTTSTTASATATTATAKPEPEKKETPEKEKKCDPKSADSPYGVKITPLTLAEATETYQSVLDLSGFSSDTHKLKINESGLLTTSSNSSKDESREAVVDFASSLGSIIATGVDASANKTMTNANFEALIRIPFPDILTPPASPPPPPPPPLASFRLLCNTLTTMLDCHSMLPAGGSPANTVTVTPRVSVLDSALTSAMTAKPENSSTGVCFDRTNASTKTKETLCPGLLFRLRRDYLVSVEVQPANVERFKPTTTTMVIPIVDASRTYSVTPVRRTFVQSKTDLTFDKGVLTGIDGEYPSTGGAVLSLPADIIKAILGGIKDILTVRIETVEKKNDLKQAVVDGAAIGKDDGGDEDK